MGYVILGELIETYTGKSLDGGIKELLELEKLGLERTDFERMDPQTDQLRIHQYLPREQTPTTSARRSIIMEGEEFCRSTAGLVDFFQALFQGKIFENPETLTSHVGARNLSTPRPKLDYQMGMYRVQVNGMDAYCHSGFWGTQVLYIPKLDLYLAANYSGAWSGGAVAPIFGKMLNALEEANPKKP